MAIKPDNKQDIISKLKKDLLVWQGFKPAASAVDSIGLGAVEHAFPGGVFPRGNIHEFMCTAPEAAAVSGGFIAGLLASLMRDNGVCLWIGLTRMIFPPALKTFGVAPERVIFVSLPREKDVLWAMEEALKCVGIAAVIAELGELDFVQSRRLQLAVEKSKVTGFVMRNQPRRIGTTACVARWQISPLPSELADGMPGVGFPRWKVELLKVRNGSPGVWELEWRAGKFTLITRASAVGKKTKYQLKTGT